ncbi:MAG TPA: zf-HC2 domain-containing protein [Steroidobacteraceae bacterium]|nr:zf-HC2 domain-containing protein [Steroidobacteraceae bacterium]
MSDHLSSQEIARFRKRLAAAQELLRMDDHARECASCRKRLAADYGIEAALLPGRTIDVSPDTEHLTYELMEAYVDGRLPPVEVDDVRAHMSVCETCAQELLDLESFRQHIQQPPAAPIVRPPVRQQRVFLLRQAAAVAALGLTALLIYLWQTGGGSSRNNTDVARVAKSDGPGSIDHSQVVPEMAALQPPTQVAVAKAIERREIDFPAALAELRGPAQTLLGSSDDGARFAVLAPVGEVVSEARPNFRWQPLQGATSYSVAIFDARLNAVQSSSKLQATQWQPAEPLQRGHFYAWQVTATLKDGTTVISPRPPSAEAKILILRQAAADELERFRQAHADAHLLLGILYAREGMLTDGETELAQVPSDDPRHDTAQMLLESIRKAGLPGH